MHEDALGPPNQHFGRLSLPARYKSGAPLIRDKLPGLPADEGSGGSSLTVDLLNQVSKENCGYRYTE
jgi:hypothetical protein